MANMPRSPIYAEPILSPLSSVQTFVIDDTPVSPLSPDEYFSAEDAPLPAPRGPSNKPSTRGVTHVGSGSGLTPAARSEAQLGFLDLEKEVQLLTARRAFLTDSLHESQRQNAALRRHVLFLAEVTGSMEAQLSVRSGSGSSSRAETSPTRHLRQRVSTLESEKLAVEQGSEEKDASIAVLEFRLQNQAEDLRQVVGALRVRDARYELLATEFARFLAEVGEEWEAEEEEEVVVDEDVVEMDEEVGEEAKEGKGKKVGWVRRIVSRRGKKA